MVKIVILITSCIDPGSMHDVARKDIRDRLRDYALALKSWGEKECVPSIVYCDNSNFDLEPLFHMPEVMESKAHWEFLSFDGNKEKAFGKGYGEMEIIRYALDNSRLISSDSFLLKVTGRLILYNACTLLSLLEKTEEIIDIYCDLRGNMQWADSRVFIATAEFLKNYLLPLSAKLNDSAGISFEHVLARATHSAMAQGALWANLPLTPDIRGVSGTSNLQYPHSRISFWRRECFRLLKSWSMGRSG